MLNDYLEFYREFTKIIRALTRISKSR